MIKVTTITSGKLLPSTRFRVRQYIKPLKNFDIEVKEYAPQLDMYKVLPEFAKEVPSKYKTTFKALWLGAKLINRMPGFLSSWNSQVTWLQREIIPFRLTLEPLLKKPLVFDIDDAIWLGTASGSSFAREVRTSVISAIAKRSDVVIAGNSYLAQWFSDYASDVRIVPTAIDTERFKPQLPDIKQKATTFVLGWTGSSSNLPYLQEIELPLMRFMNEFKDSELLIVSDKPPSFKRLPSKQIRYIPWSSELEVEAVKQMDVGLMPLPDNEWTKGKCSFKMLQYMACGIPVVVSPVGMNTEILNLGNIGIGAVQPLDWYDAFVFFYNNRALGDACGKLGRAIVEKHFSQKVVIEKIVKVFRDLS